MFKITILCVGKIKEDFYRSAMAEYLKRLSRFAKTEVRELPEGKSIEDEADGICKAMKGYVFALCIEGKKLSSLNFASEINGSSHGLSEKVKERADFRVSFSDMTFPHQLMRVILAEQIYRAFMINGGSEYHK